MKKILLALMILFVNVPFSQAEETAHAAKHWTYEGEEGPEHWADVDPKFALCHAGVNQSPINVTNAIQASLPTIEFKYSEASLNLVNNGHTIQVDLAPGSTITVDGSTFDLLQFHFHAPSENQIEGMSYPMEAHLVHKDKAGHLAVIGVMIKAGQENPLLKELWSHLSEAKVGVPVQKDDIKINAYSLLPDNKKYYRFDGSLTTPPCTEGVQWMLMKDSIEASAEQIKAFNDLIGNNNRPVQAINARQVLK